MEILILAVSSLLGLLLLAGVHNLGHLVFAKIFRMKVEIFSLGIGPKLFGVKMGQTEYALRAVPIGGFVKVSGMNNKEETYDSLDAFNHSESHGPSDYKAKPAEQRLMVMMGGIVANIILGIIIFT